MTTSGDYGATMQHIFNKNVTHSPSVKYPRPITAGEIQDRLRSLPTGYSENNPEPPDLKK